MILLCDEGYQRSLAAATLQQLGFARATDVEGGFQAWRIAALPYLLAAARQIFLIERYVTRKVRKRRKNSRRYKTAEVKTAVAVFGITSLSAREAAPEHLVGYVRGHWAIENKIHWVRVMSHSVRMRPGSGPHPGPASWSPYVTSRWG